VNNDSLLLKQVNYSKSSIQDDSDEETLVRCENIADAAEKVKDVLVSDFGLDEAVLTQLKADIASIRKLISTRTDISGEGKAATSAVKESIGQIRSRFDQPDDLVYGILDDDNFLKVYTNTRQIIDR
jgi:hypothetical protein